MTPEKKKQEKVTTEFLLPHLSKKFNKDIHVSIHILNWKHFIPWDDSNCFNKKCSLTRKFPEFFNGLLKSSNLHKQLNKVHKIYHYTLYIWSYFYIVYISLKNIFVIYLLGLVSSSTISQYEQLTFYYIPYL